MDALPEEVLLKILSYLSPYKDFKSALLVCHKWQRVIKTIVHTIQREFRQSIVNGELLYAKYDYRSGGPRQQQDALRNDRPSFGIRSHRNNISQNYPEPNPRFSHSCCVMGSYMYVFGGCSLSNSSSNSAFNDLYAFDIMEKTWERVTVNQGYMPAPRECSTLIAYDEKLVIFGGWSSPRSTEVTGIPKFFNDTSIIDVKNKTCSVVSCHGREIPGTRAGHSACLSKDKMVVFGGAQRISRFVQPCMKFSTFNMFAPLYCRPKDFIVQSGAQDERDWCPMCRYDDVWILDMDTLIWNHPNITGRKPEGRFGQSQFTIGDDHIFIIGGCGGSNSLFDDAWLLNTKTWIWSEIEVQNKLWQPPDLWCHPASKIGNLIVTFSDQTICSSCIGLQSNPLQTSLFDGPVPVPSITCTMCKQNKVKKQNYDSQFQLYTLDVCNLLKTTTVSWTSTPSFVPQHLSRSRSLFTIVTGRGEILIFGGVFNMEKLKITRSPPTGVLTIKQNH